MIRSQVYDISHANSNIYTPQTLFELVDILHEFLFLK